MVYGLQGAVPKGYTDSSSRSHRWLRRITHLQKLTLPRSLASSCFTLIRQSEGEVYSPRLVGTSVIEAQ